MRAKWACVALLVFGCSSDETRNAESDPSGKPIYSDVNRDDAPGVVAETICGLWMQECNCRFVPFSSYEQCRDSSTGFLEEQFQTAEADGLTYDAACMAEVANFMNHTVGCQRLSELQQGLASQLQRPPCKAFYGTAQEGDMCEPYYVVFGDSCAQGLQCLGTCMPAPSASTLAPDGGACDGESVVCELGALCDSGVCVRQPGQGEPCTVACDVGFHCDTTDGVCEPPPGLGEACIFSPTAPRCAAGHYCGPDDTCIEALAENANCGGDEECGAGYTCQEVRDQPGGDVDQCLTEEALICI